MSIESLPGKSDDLNQTRQFRSLDDLLETDVMSECSLRIQGGGMSCELDTVRVKGRLNPVRIYTLGHNDSEQSRNAALYQGFYRMGLEQYRLGAFSRAQALFARAAAYGDPPGQCMRDRVGQLLSAGLPPAWDGIWNLETE